MDADIVDEVTSWETRSFEGGHAGLQALADAEFSGAVDASGTWLFFLNGKIVGIFEGSIEGVADADGTAYEAPGLALPLLFTMRQRDGERQARYYSEDTPLEEVDETLTDANFTGYVELSENVLSGDYYVTYYGGRSLAAAFVGNRAEVVTGQEAFDRAADEVGIYEVFTVPIDVTDIPEPDEDSESPGGVVSEPPEEDDEDDPTEEPAESPDAEEHPSRDEDVQSESEEASPDHADRTESTQPSDVDGSAPEVTESASTTGEREERFDEEEQWQETRTIPSLSPSDSDPGAEQAQSTTTQPTAENPGTTGTDKRVAELENAIEQRDAKIAELQDRLDSVRAERDSAQTERDELAAELETLREEREELRERIESLEGQEPSREPVESSDSTGGSLDPESALAQTNLFVRYGSKGDATLEAVPDGVSAQEVNANLQLDHHTQFDDAATTVGGESFEAFLVDTPEYAFVEWVIRDLPYEIRETGHDRELVDLYEAIPKIDRAELHGSVTAESEEGQATASYDVVLRGRKGDPLIVASINDSRDPVTGEMMQSLVEQTSAVAGSLPTISSAMSVTASFFKPDALEMTEEATGGGFLSRDGRESFVRTSRKQGYHLCLVESRKGSFHVTVPEL